MEDVELSIDTIAMQAFTGVSIFSILMLMALGLTIVFGLMGVVNMAHGELMAMGAYTTYGVSIFFQKYFPGLLNAYFLIGICTAFVVTFFFGYFLERTIIRRLYKRPLDTMLATWGIGLILQQLFRQFISPRPVSVPTSEWLQGSLYVTESLSFPLSRIFIIFLSITVATLLYIFLHKTRWGILIRAVTQNREMSGAAGINQDAVNTYTFSLGCGLAGIAGSSFTMLAATAPDIGQSYIVDTFIVVVFGGVQSLFGTILSAALIGQMQTWLEFYFSGSMARASILMLVIVVLYFRPNGLFYRKVRG